MTHERTHSLLAFARELQRAATFQDLVVITHAELVTALGYTHVWFFVADSEEAEEWRLIDYAGVMQGMVWEVAPVLKIKGDAMLEEIARGAAPVVVSDARIDPRTDKRIVEQLGNRTIINVPLYLLDKPFGAFGTGTFGDEGCRPPTPSQLDHLVGMANQLSVAAGRIRFLEERKRAEDALRKSEEDLRITLQSIGDAVISTDATGCIRRMNPVAEKLTGWTADEAQGLPLSEVFQIYNEYTRQQLESPVERVLREGRVVGLANHTILIARDGVERVIADSGAPILDKAGEIQGVVLVFRDQSEERRAEALLRAKETAETANAELEAFNYSVSHDLRAPLRAIEGFSGLLLEEYALKLDDIGRDYISRVRAGAQRMRLIIDDLLELSRITHATLKRVDLDLAEIVREVEDALRHQEPSRQVEVRVEHPMNVSADPRLMKIALENLLGNAWKFTSKQAQASIHVGVEPGAPRVFYVRDNGAGFDMAFVDKLFVPFQRLHRAADFQGTGIGLTTVQRIIARHGGRIWGEGHEDRGAKFCFTLPRIESSTEQVSVDVQ